MSRPPLRTLVFAGLAVMMAGGTYLVSQGLVAANANAARAAVPASEILVTVKPLAVGSTIAAGDLAWRPWPKAGIDPAYIASGTATLASFTGHVVRSAMLAGEPVTLDRVPAPGARGALALVTRPGFRAVSVALTPTTGVSGLIVPGDHVDVVLSYVLPRPADGGSGIDRRAATTILTDLRVLAIDQRLAADTGEVKDIRNASLEVSAKQSEILALAADLGKLSLSLRSLQQPPDAAVPAEAVGGSTLDYQVGPLLQRAAKPAAPRPAAAPAARLAGPGLNEFHGSSQTNGGGQ